jgi:hypothetical protein
MQMKILAASILAIAALAAPAFAQDKAPEGKAPPEKPAPAAIAVPPDVEEKPVDAKAAQEEEKKAQEEARRAAAQKKALDYQRYKDELMKQCVIKPVMTDEEINLCKKAYKA